jgi:hypothetical protein
MTETTKISLGDSPVLKPRPADLHAGGRAGGDTALHRPPCPTTLRPGLRRRWARPPRGVRSEARNPLLDALVYGDNDLVGLVAYAMHEVNRRDWCLAYEAAHGRPPSEGELNAYLVGEQLERRLDTYRRLAEDALAKVATAATRQCAGWPRRARIANRHRRRHRWPPPSGTGAPPVAVRPAPVAAACCRAASTPRLSDKAIVAAGEDAARLASCWSISCSCSSRLRLSRYPAALRHGYHPADQAGPGGVRPRLRTG